MIPLTLLKRFWPLAVGAALILAIFLLVRCTDRAQDHAVEQAGDNGRAEQRADDLTETINRTEKADAAEEAVRRDADVRRDGCLRHSRTPENCD